MVASILSARSSTASGSELTTCSELVPGRQGVLRSPVLDTRRCWTTTRGRPQANPIGSDGLARPVPGIIRSSVNPRPSNQSRNTSASSLTTLAQTLCWLIPLVRTAIVDIKSLPRLSAEGKAPAVGY
jgi:hypothetical protein